MEKITNMIIAAFGGYSKERVQKTLNDAMLLGEITAMNRVKNAMEMLYSEDDGLWRHNAWTYVEHELERLKNK